MSKHTPAPWAIYEDGLLDAGKRTIHHRGIASSSVERGAFTKIARMDNADDGEGLANARLVAAAPDLLEALSMVEWANYTTCDNDCVRWHRENKKDCAGYHCPCCENGSRRGHSEDCYLNTAIKKAVGDG